MGQSLDLLYLPEGLPDYFEIEYYGEFCMLSNRERGILIRLKERNILPEGYSTSDYESKGFTEPVVIQDFPIRGKMVLLSMRCRRWRNKNNSKDIIKRDFSFLADGIRMTTGLVDFLKGMHRDPRRYDLEYL